MVPKQRRGMERVNWMSESGALNGYFEKIDSAAFSIPTIYQFMTYDKLLHL